jgi:hypothetical protein
MLPEDKVISCFAKRMVVWVAGEGGHKRTDSRFREAAEAKVYVFDWIISKEIREVGKFSGGVGKALNEVVGGRGKA